MTKKWAGLPKTRVHLEIYKEDWIWLTARFPRSAASTCCEIIHNKVRSLRQREIDQSDQINQQLEEIL